MYTERKIHSGFIGTLFLIATLVLVLFHTRTAQQQLSNLATQREALATEVNALLTQQANLTPQGLLSEVEQKDLAQAIPEKIQQDGILSDLNRIAKTTNISFNALSFSPGTGADLPTVNITAAFQGTPEDIVRFLKLVEVNPRKLVVKDAGVLRSQSVGGLDLVNLNLTLQAFYRIES